MFLNYYSKRKIIDETRTRIAFLYNSDKNYKIVFGDASNYSIYTYFEDATYLNFYLPTVYSQTGRTISKIPRDLHWNGAELSKRCGSIVTACRRRPPLRKGRSGEIRNTEHIVSDDKVSEWRSLRSIRSRREKTANRLFAYIAHCKK